MTTTSAALAAALVAGGVAGALLPVVAYRLAVPSGRPARSRCHRCTLPLAPGWRGWLPPAGRCRGCRARLGPPRWAACGAAAAAAGVAAWCTLGHSAGAPPAGGALLAATAIGALALGGVLAAAVDVAALRLPDAVTAPTAGVAAALLAAAAAVDGAWPRLGQAGAAAALLATAHLCVAVLPGRPLGMGDVKWSALWGLALGWWGWPTVAVGAAAPYLIQGPVAGYLLLRRRATGATPLPLGPALLAGTLLAGVVTR